MTNLSDQPIGPTLMTNIAILVRKSVFTGKTSRMFFPQYTQDELDKRIAYWKNNSTLIQDVFPELNADEREFILSGATPEEFNELFGNG